MIFFTKYPSKNRILPLIHLVFCPLGHLDFYPGNGKGLYGAHQPGCYQAMGKKSLKKYDQFTVNISCFLYDP